MAEKQTKKRKETQDYPRIRWCFTEQAVLGDEKDEVPMEREEHAMFLMEQLKPHCDVIAFQLEMAPTTGQLHYQGYFELTIKKRFDWIQTHIRKFHYLVKAKGKPVQAWKYCTKQETRQAGPWTYGEPRAHENANKTEEFVKAVKNGETDEMLWENHPSCMARLDQVPNRIRGLKVPQRTQDLEVYVFFGGAGKGKSRMVRTLYPDVYVLPFGQKVWLTSRGCLAKVVMLEDFDGNMQLKQFNRMIDRYPEEVETKGGFTWWMPDIIFIATNIVPSQWWPDDGRQDVKEQIFRRIDACYDFNHFSWTAWEAKRIMPPKYTVEELEKKYYLQRLPKLQIEAYDRTTVRYNTTGGVVRSDWKSRKETPKVLADDGINWEKPYGGFL